MKNTILSGDELNGQWMCRLSASRASAIATHNGQDLQAMVVAALRTAGGSPNSNLAQSVGALTVDPASGYDAAARRSWSITSSRRGKFTARASLRSGGEERVSNDFTDDTFDSLQDAIVWVVTELGHPAFGVQIAAL